MAMIETVILADSSSEGSGAVALFLFALGPAAGLAIWGYIKARYRNAGARYMPERVVDFKVTSLEKSDTYLRETKSSSSRMSGANEDDVHVRAQFVRVFQHGELEQPTESPDSGAGGGAEGGPAPGVAQA